MPGRLRPLADRNRLVEKRRKRLS